MAEMPKAIKLALYRLGAVTHVHLERTAEGGGRMILRGADMAEERIGYTLSDAEIYEEAYEQIGRALLGESTLLPEEVEERVNMTRRHVYGTLYEASKKKWDKKK